MTIGFKLSKVMCLLLLLMFTNLASSIFTGFLYKANSNQWARLKPH